MRKTDFEESKGNFGKSIQFAPKKTVMLDFEKFGKFLKKKEYPIEIETSSLMVFKVGGLQITLNSDGKTVVRTQSWAIAENAFREILPGISRSLK